MATNNAAVPGLSQAEAALRLQRDGRNELPSAKPRSLLRIGLEVMREPMFLLLLSCSIIYLLLGEPRDAVVLAIAMLVVIGITLYQAQKTERALAALHDLSSPRALVIRDGERQRIAGNEVVIGDWVVLSEGDRVPADGVLRDANQLQADESLLTGESLPVSKHSDAVLATLARPGGDNTALVYSGTLITRGSGVAEILATGRNTELGRIGKALQSQTRSDSALQRESARLVRTMGILAVLLATLLVLVYGFNHGNWLQAVLAGIAVSMSLLPEELPVVMTVFMALGAWQMSRQQVLTRKLAAIEALGAASVLCVDKTGTLTENRMTVAVLHNADGFSAAVTDAPLPEALHTLVEYALLATRQDPFDPMERAIRELGLSDHIDASHLHTDWQMVREYPLSRELLAMSQVWRSTTTGQQVIAAKGAPEAIAELCHLEDTRRAQLLEQVSVFAQSGLRVLAVARATMTHPDQHSATTDTALPAHQHAFAFEYLGLLALVDPIRKQVPAAVAACHSAGIRVLMITGDYPGTAVSIAQQAGLAAPDAVLLGAEIEQLDDATLRQRLRNVSVIARAVPEHKLRIVSALQADGDVVAMTGDGVNDAPALRAADIGVAMGGRGTDVAREAAAIVLTDDNFRSIVDAVQSGRRIFQNLRRATQYIIAVHVPIAGLCLLPLLIGWPMLLLPTHIAFLQLIIDPACAIAFEAEPGDERLMREPPRQRHTPLLSRDRLLRALLEGTLVLLAVMGLTTAANMAGLPEAELRALGFSLLVLGNLALILANRSGSRHVLSLRHADNPALWWIAGGTLLALLATMTVPMLQSTFRVALPGPTWWAVLVAMALTLLVLFFRLNRAPPSRPDSAK